MKTTQYISLFLLVLAVVLLPAASRAESAQKNSKVLVIAHRGASSYRPEHTLAAYELAINLGADYIEPDLVSTKDGHLIARHENEISETTDVAQRPEFSQRRSRKEIDGVVKEGWFSEDFSLAELKQLRVRERLPQIRKNNTIYDGIYQIPTVQEIIDLVKRKNKELGKDIGLYIELKHPSYFASINLPLQDSLLKQLESNGYKRENAPVFIQCFEPSTLKSLKKSSAYALVQLIDESGKPYDAVLSGKGRSFAEMLTKEGLTEIAAYAKGIGPNKNSILPRDENGKLLSASDLIGQAHALGLLVHPWTFRNENPFLPADYRSCAPDDPCAQERYGKALDEYRLFYKLGVDGVFSENPDTAIEVRDRIPGIK